MAPRSYEAQTRGAIDTFNPPTTLMTIDNFNVDQFNDSFLHYADVTVGSFPCQKREVRPPAFIPNTSPRDGLMWQQKNAKTVTATTDLGTGNNELPNFPFDYALLEQVLENGERSEQSPTNTPKDTVERSVAPPMLEPEFYFGDILGDDGVASQSLSNAIKSEGITVDDAFGEGENLEERHFQRAVQRPEMNDDDYSSAQKSEEIRHADTDLSSAIASLVGSNDSTEYKENEMKPVELTGFHESVSRKGTDAVSRMDDYVAREQVKSEFDMERVNMEMYQGLKEQRPFDREVKNKRRTDGSSAVQHDEVSLNRESMNGSCISKDESEEMDDAIKSPVSDSSMSGPSMDGRIEGRMGSHPDLYYNLSPKIRRLIDRLREKISKMSRRKLRKSLALGVTLDEVEPLMCVNRDELAYMLGVGVTTWKMFVHHTLGIPRWPARALKSQQGKERKMLQKKEEAERRGDFELAMRVGRELNKMTYNHKCQRNMLRCDAKTRIDKQNLRRKKRL